MDKKKEEQNTKCYVISVESRKGGVGKTTIALNTGRILLEQNYEVVFFNFDFQGTDLKMLESSLNNLKIWGNYTPYMVEEPSVLKKKSDNPKKINLVKLFDNYMGGMGVPDVVWGERKESVISLQPGKLNILCSRLKREGESKKNLYEIATLFDEMHSAWFLSMVKELIKKMKDSMLPCKNKLAVILDNGTGLTGLEPSVDEWLTDIGPEYGKFLFVCTLDIQDFAACADAACSIHTIYSEKWDISQYLYEVEEIDKEQKKENEKSKGEDKGNTLEKKCEKIIDGINKKNRMSRFFYRLVESGSDTGMCEKCDKNPPYSRDNLLCQADDFCFYKKKTDERIKFGNTCEEKPGAYVGIIVNKIPILIYDADYSFDIERAFKQSEARGEPDKPDDGEESGDNCKKNIREFILKENENRVLYRDEFAYQFITVLPNKSDESDPKTAGYPISSPRNLFIRLKEFKDEFKSKMATYRKIINNSEKGSAIIYETFLNIEFEYDRIFIDLFNQVKPSLESDLRNFRVEDFYIIASKEKFFESIFELFKSRQEYSTYKEHAKVFIDHVSGRIREKNKNIDNETAKEAAEILETDINQIVLGIIHNIGESYTLTKIIPNIKTEKLLALDMALLKGKKLDMKKVKNLITLLCVMQCVAILKVDKKKTLDIEAALNSPDFWKEQIKNDFEITNIAMEILEQPSIQKLVENIEITDYPDQLVNLYKEAINVRIRVLDLYDDFEFLYDCFRLILLKRQITSLVIVPIAKIAREVIIDRVKSHEEGRASLQLLFPKQKLFQKGEELLEPIDGDDIENDPVKVLRELERVEDFDRVIRPILGAERWKMI